MATYVNMVKRGTEMRMLVTFTPMVVGEIIKWGKDEEQPDGLACWEVMSVWQEA